MSAKSERAKALQEKKEKAIQILESLVNNPKAILSTKYLKSHEKIAILYKEHVIEVHGGEEKYIKYMTINIPLTPKEHKKVYSLFMEEVKRRKEDITLKKFDEFEQLINK